MTRKYDCHNCRDTGKIETLDNFGCNVIFTCYECKDKQNPEIPIVRVEIVVEGGVANYNIYVGQTTHVIVDHVDVDMQFQVREDYIESVIKFAKSTLYQMVANFTKRWEFFLNDAI